MLPLTAAGGGMWVCIDTGHDYTLCARRLSGMLKRKLGSKGQERHQHLRTSEVSRCKWKASARTCWQPKCQVRQAKTFIAVSTVYSSLFLHAPQKDRLATYSKRLLSKKRRGSKYIVVIPHVSFLRHRQLLFSLSYHLL